MPKTLQMMDARRSARQSNTGIGTIILHSTQTEYDLNYKHRLDWRAQLRSKTVTTYYTVMYMAV